MAGIGDRSQAGGCDRMTATLAVAEGMIRQPRQRGVDLRVQVVLILQHAEHHFFLLAGGAWVRGLQGGLAQCPRRLIVHAMRRLPSQLGAIRVETAEQSE